MQADFRNISRRAAARRGMVAADSSRCSEIGRNVLSQQRGNAIDAAVAVALCQGVVNPVASGLGGGAFIMVRLANGSGLFLDARETAPGAATADMFAGAYMCDSIVAAQQQ
jgi:gamma-glutamyltranspeptidase/glutathione hydrolase/leukotriene-C4 hydrolase